MITATQLLTHSLRVDSRLRTLPEILAAALLAVDPANAVQATLRCEGESVIVGERRYDQVRRVVVVGAGKAGVPMAQAAADVLGERIDVGLVIVKEGHLGASGDRIGPISVFEGGHPVPNARGVVAAEQLAALLVDLRSDDLVLVLLSGGGSALLTLPVPSLDLTDLQALTTALLRCGAPIGHINTLRKHCTQLGGGQMAARAAPAQVATLIVSDVVGSPLDVIASGPTAPDPTTFADAWALVERYALHTMAPPAIITHLRRGLGGDVPETPKAHDPLWEHVTNHVIASNATAAQATVDAAQRYGFNALLLTTFLEGEARDVGRMVTALARELAQHDRPLRRPAVLVMGGETTVTLRGDGLGGRNQELALGALSGLAELPNTCIIALATDGGDGPTDAAGAVVTGDTLRRARALGLDPIDFLERNDAYHFFEVLDDVLRSGPTLTNVNDLLVIAVA